MGQATHRCGTGSLRLYIRQAPLGALHHSEHHLARDHAFLGHAELAHIVILLRQSGCADRGHVLEHDGQVLIDREKQQTCKLLIDIVLVFNHRIHRQQQVLVLDCLGHHVGQGDGFDPAQCAHLGVWMAQAICSGQPIPDTTLSFSSATAGASPWLN